MRSKLAYMPSEGSDYRDGGPCQQPLHLLSDMTDPDSSKCSMHHLQVALQVPGRQITAVHGSCSWAERLHHHKLGLQHRPQHTLDDLVMRK
jgi:hypothetical protein